jgi:hypothetical protein
VSPPSVSARLSLAFGSVEPPLGVTGSSPSGSAEPISASGSVEPPLLGVSEI